ncbi:MAG: HlyD family type I secretion periplasmic adaptor subunit [Alphaproteobacteria bacterium]
MTGRRRDQQLRYLAQSARLEEIDNHRLIRLTLLTISIAILVFIGWSAQATISEMSRAPGEVVPEGSQRTVQHLEGGRVAEILVRNGQIVDKDQALMVLDGSGVEEDLERARSKQLSLQIKAERLRAFIEGREPDFAGFDDVSDGYVLQQRESFRSMLKARQNEKKIVRAQITQKNETIALLKARRQNTADELTLVSDLHERHAKLFSQGYLTRSKLVETERQRNGLLGDLTDLDNQIRQAKVTLYEFENRLLSLDANHSDDAYRQLDDVEAELRQNREIVAKLRHRAERLTIRAPIHGVVKGLTVNNVGAVIASGQVITELVPLNEKLVVDVRIPPQHVGHLSTGQAVQVRVSSYDFGRYGAVAGRLEAISATTFVGERGERYYRGRIRLEQNYVGNDPMTNTILPGMTVMADIITGEKTVLDYLLKPIRQSIKTAFTER